jgi:endoglucanase
MPSLSPFPLRTEALNMNRPRDLVVYLPWGAGVTAGLTGVLLASCLSAPAQAPLPQSVGTATAVKPSEWNAKPVDGSPGVNPPPISGHNLILKESFKDGKSLPWTTSFTVPGDGSSAVENGELCVAVKNKGVNRWDVQLRHRDMVIEKGHTYSVKFTMHATQKTRAVAKIGMSGPPYREYFSQTLDLEPGRQIFKGIFTMQADDDATPELAFHLGGNMAADAKEPFSVCVDDVHVEDPQFMPNAVVVSEPIARVLVNQTGYFPRLAKVATVKAATPAPWELRDSSSHAVATGTTTAFGPDAASGDSVSLADFSSFTQEGSGFTLAVGSDVSHPFDISNSLYTKLKYQALAYFYHTRSGIEIKLPFAGEAQWTHPAGHLSEPPNRGDRKVACAPDSGCTYSLDVTGGWYDAGDHGKYVVNGGVSVWTLLDAFERARFLGSSVGDFGDGKLNIPEKANGAPDLLDEARWEIEFELKMQVPEGEKLAGMVHHKVHDKVWTALGLAPQDDPIERLLYAPSTAATLNMAANAAQAARLWRGVDKAFSEKCLLAAEKAWKAAEAHPAIFAKPGGVGGGPYEDDNVTDEFYWAAAELFITTKKPVYREYVTHSPHFKRVPATTGGGGPDSGIATPLTWGNVQSLGSISLAVVPNGLPAGELDAIRKNIVASADAYLELASKQGYRVPFKPGAKGYPWGSNSFILNNLIIIALAHDITHDAKYLNGVAEGMDYILGRNPLDQSYVTGYGERPLQNPHHRFWAHQANHKFPKAPPGIVSGGPNSGLEDPYVQAAGLKGCAPETCFLDNIEAWSVNEITINWNSPLFWVAAFLDEQGQRGPKAGRHAAEGKGKAAVEGKPRTKSKTKGQEH